MEQYNLYKTQNNSLESYIYTRRHQRLRLSLSGVNPSGYSLDVRRESVVDTAIWRNFELSVGVISNIAVTLRNNCVMQNKHMTCVRRTDYGCSLFAWKPSSTWNVFCMPWMLLITGFTEFVQSFHTQKQRVKIVNFAFFVTLRVMEKSGLANAIKLELT